MYVYLLRLFLKTSFLKASIISLNTIRPIYDSLNGHVSGPKHIGITLLIAVSTCVFSFGCASILWWLDNRRRQVQCEDNSNDAGLLPFLSTNPMIRFYLFFFQPMNFAFEVRFYSVLY